MKKSALILTLTLPLMLLSCAGPLSEKDQRKDAKSAPESVSGGALSESAATRYMDKEMAALSEVFPQSEEHYVLRDGNKLLLTFESDLFFDDGATAIKAEGYGKIHQLSQILTKFPDTKIEISAHTDSPGSEQHNLKLSEERAKAVKEALASDKVDPQRITSVGYGESRPIVSNATEHGKKLNRRITVEIAPIKAG